MRRTSLSTHFWLIPVLLILSSTKSSSGDEYDVQAIAHNFTSSSSPTEWTTSSHYHRINGYANRPAKEAWQPIAVQWQAPEIDPLGNTCLIRGQLVLPGEDPSQAAPVNWFQGITIYTASTPGVKLDWSKGMELEDTCSDTGVVGPTGKFRFRFDLSKTQYKRAISQSFQFGVALAEHIDLADALQQVVWNSHAPVVPTSVQMLEIPAAPKLPRELELINAARGWPFSDPNGLRLVRAVNSLQRIGKADALSTLETFIKLMEPTDVCETDIVFWIIRSLFEPIRLDDRIPVPMACVSLDDSELPLAAKWPLNPMAIAYDVPFMLGSRHGGQNENPSSHIEWARRYGVIRDQPLAPSVDPILAVDSIIGNARFQQLNDDGAKRFLKQQAMHMIEELIKSLPEEFREPPDDDDQWGKMIKATRSLKIHWDPDREVFVSLETK